MILVRHLRPFVGVAVGLLWAASALGADPTPTRVIRLSDGCTVRLLNIADGRAALAADNPEPYLTAMSRADIELRLAAKLDPARTKENLDRLRAVRADSVRDWTDEEADVLVARLKSLHKLAADHYPGLLPEQWIWVKTTGAGEAPAEGYTVGGVIVLHEANFRRTRDAGEERTLKLLAHETFHVLSRTRPRLREACYRAAGFELVKSLDWGGLADRRLTNPDGLAPAVIKLKDGDREVTALPVIYSNTPGFDEKVGADLFKYMRFGLFEVRWDPKTGEAVLPSPTVEPLGAGVRKNYTDLIGRNTGYVIHADEILAENFALLLLSHDPRYADAHRKKFDFTLPDKLAAAFKAADAKPAP